LVGLFKSYLWGERVKYKNIVIGIAVAIAIGTSTTPAHAGSELCPSSRVCIYVDENFIGLLGYRSAGGGLVNLSSGAINKMSSWENLTSTDASWYTEFSGVGDCRTMGAGLEKALVVTGYNDRMKSWRTDHGC